MESKAFNLFDFGLKKAEKILLFDENSLDSEGNIIIPLETQVAIVSHYLHNKGTQFESTYKEKAQQYIQLWTNWFSNNKELCDIDHFIAAESSALDA